MLRDLERLKMVIEDEVKVAGLLTPTLVYSARALRAEHESRGRCSAVLDRPLLLSMSRAIHSITP
jgi:hypothetical protein